MAVVLGEPRRPPRPIRPLLPCGPGPEIATLVQLVARRRDERGEFAACDRKCPHRERPGDRHLHLVFALAARSGSSAGEPIVKVPAGTTTISGHSAQSLNRSPPPGWRQRRSPAPMATSTPSQLCAAAVPTSHRVGWVSAATVADKMLGRRSARNPTLAGSKCLGYALPPTTRSPPIESTPIRQTTASRNAAVAAIDAHRPPRCFAQNARVRSQASSAAARSWASRCSFTKPCSAS